MIKGTIRAVDQTGMTITSQDPTQRGDLELRATTDGAIAVRIKGFGLGFIGRGIEVRVVPEPDGAWEIAGGDALDADIADFVRTWAGNFALANLDTLSHSLQGTRLQRLDAMERLHAAVVALGARQDDGISGPGHEELAAPILLKTAMGPLVMTFGSDRIADVAIPAEGNLSRADGYVRFFKDPDFGWRSEPRNDWDLARCANRFDRPIEEAVQEIMQPLVAIASRLHWDAEERNASARPAPEASPSRPMPGTLAALAADIEALKSSIVATPVQGPTVRTFGRRTTGSGAQAA